jgi:hypothetical protein
MTLAGDAPVGRPVEETERWLLSDVLVLEAVAHVPHGGDVELRQLIATADYLEQILLSHEEIERAVNLLLDAGLLVQHDDRLRLTESGRVLLDRTPAGCVRERTLWLQHNLPVAVAARHPRWQLEDATYARAVDAYHHGFTLG